MVKNGFYLVHRHSLPAARIEFDDFVRRQSLTTYPLFARYKFLSTDEFNFAVNGRGEIIVFQRIDAESEQQARVVFENQDCFAPAYEKALRISRNFLAITIPDFDETFFLFVGGDELFVSWNRVVLPLPPGEEWRFQILIEAIFIGGLCKDSERCLADLLSNRSITSPIRNLLEYARDLIFVEQPEHYLINSDEIELLTGFYRTWKISESVCSLQTRFSQAIDTFNLNYSRIQAQRAMSLNRFVGAATVIALLQVSDNLAIPIIGLTSDFAKFLILGVATILLFWGIAGDVWRTISEWRWRLFKERPLQRRLQWISRKDRNP